MLFLPLHHNSRLGRPLCYVFVWWQRFIISASSPLALHLIHRRCLHTWRFPWKTSELANISRHVNKFSSLITSFHSWEPTFPIIRLWWPKYRNAGKYVGQVAGITRTPRCESRNLAHIFSCISVLLQSTVLGGFYGRSDRVVMVIRASTFRWNFLLLPGRRSRAVFIGSSWHSHLSSALWNLQEAIL